MKRKYIFIPKDNTHKNFIEVRQDSKFYRNYKRKSMKKLYADYYNKEPPKAFPIRKWYKALISRDGNMLLLLALLMFDMDKIEFDEDI